MQGEQEIGIDRVIADHGSLLGIQTRQVIAPPNAVEGHGFHAFAEPHAAADIVGRGRLIVRAQVIRQAVQRGMHRRAVQALVVILDDQLPVSLDVVDDPLVELELAHPPRREFVWQLAELFS
jgi:hypothetical protein